MKTPEQIENERLAPAPTTAAPAEQPGKAADPRPAQPQAPAEQWRSPECQYELPRLLEIASRHVPQEAEAFVRDLRAAAEHFREHPPAAPSEAPLAEEPRCQAVTRNGHRCGKEPHEEGDDEHEADNAAEGGSTLVWTEHYPHAEAPLDALREALGDATVYALRVGKALRDLIDVVSSDGDEPRRMRHAVSKAVTEGRAALSAPPPPSREPASAPPRKAPQEGPDDARAEEFRLGWNAGWLAGREAAAQEAGVRFGTAAEDALFALAAPSSPEEQLSGKELK